MANITVPSVVGSTASGATNTLENYDFVVAVSYTSVGATLSNDGFVKSQSPSAGTSRPLGSTVTITVYQYSAPTTTTAPNVVGLTVDAAEAAILSASLTPQGEAVSSGATASNDNKVYAQAYSAGSSRPIGSLFPYSYYHYTNWLGLGIFASRGVINPNTIQISWTAHNELSTGTMITVSSSPDIFYVQRYLGSGESNSWFSNPIPADPYTTYTFTISGPGKYGTESNSITLSGATPPSYPPSWSDNVLADTFRVGEPYSDSVTASGTSPMTYTKTAGNFPDGVTMSGGVLSGTPTTKGAYSFTIQASNGVGSPVTASFSGTVGPAKGGVYVYDGTNWIDSTVNTLDGSGGSASAEVYYYNGSSWVKSF